MRSSFGRGHALARALGASVTLGCLCWGWAQAPASGEGAPSTAIDGGSHGPALVGPPAPESPAEEVATAAPALPAEAPVQPPVEAPVEATAEAAVEAPARRPRGLPSAMGPVYPDDGPREIWSSRCAGCHARDGSARTWLGNRHLARNLTDARWQDDVTNAQLVEVIRYGVGGTFMRGFDGKMSERQLLELVAFIRTLRQGAAAPSGGR